MTDIRMLYDEATIAARIEAMAGEIAAVLPRDFVMVGLLKGSFVFVADLARALHRAGAAHRIPPTVKLRHGQAERRRGASDR